MSQIYSYYLRAKQKYNQKSLFVWFYADSDKKAQNKLPYLMDEAGINEEYFFKPIRTNLPVVDELPPEGVFDSEIPQRFTHDANTNDWFPANSNDDQSQTEETAGTDSSSISFWKLPTEQRVALVDMYNISDKEPIEAEHVARVRDMLNAEGELHPGNYNRAIGMGKVEAISGMNAMGIRKMLDQIREHFNGRTPKWPDITNFVRKQLSQISLNKSDDNEPFETSTKENNESHTSGSYATLDMNVMLSIMNVRPQQAKAADVRTAKEFIDKRDGTWRAISSVLRVIVGICDVETDVIFNITQDALKNLEMVQDRSALLSFMKDKLAGNPACPELAEPQSDTSKLFDESPLAQKLYEGKNDAEEEQSSSTMENEPAAAETVAPDTNEHTQEPQTLETQSPVEAEYQKKRAELHEARKNIPPKNAPLPQTTDSASNEGEKIEDEPSTKQAETVSSHSFQQRAKEIERAIAEKPASVKNNLHIWRKVQSTDPQYTKALDTGNFTGTSINAEYMFMRATELFGPIGSGWGYEIFEDQMLSGAPMSETILENGKFVGKRILRDADGTLITELNHSIGIRFWYMSNEVRNEVISFGATPYLYMSSKNKTVCDGEVKKKSLTDAIKKALSMLGFSADIYLGHFDNLEYKTENAVEFEIKNAANKAGELTRIRSELDAELSKIADTLRSAVTKNEVEKVLGAFARKVNVHIGNAEKSNDSEYVKYLKGRLNRLRKIADERIAQLEAQEEAA